MAPRKNKSTEPRLVTVTLKKDMNQAGEKKKAGAEIQVKQRQVDWLKQEGVI